MANGKRPGEIIPLTQKQRDNFEELTGITGDKSDRLIRVLEQAAFWQIIISKSNDKGLTHHETLKSLDSLLVSLKKAKAEMRNLEDYGFSFDCYMFNGASDLNPEVYRGSLIRKHKSATCAAHAMLMEVHQAVDLLRTSRPDRISRESAEYTDSLSRIAEVFKEEQLGKISSDQNSVFFKVVCFFMSGMLGVDISNPQRHIETLIGRLNKKQIIEI